MKTLDFIREEVAQREGYDTWDDLFMDAINGSITSNVFDVLITDIATMYVKEFKEEVIGELAFEAQCENKSFWRLRNTINTIQLK